MPENVATFLRHVPAATVRPDLVMQYLRYLKAINPHYTHIQINDTIEAVDAMNALPGQLFNGRWIIDNAGIVALERIAVGNPAESLQEVDFLQIPTNDINCDDVTVMDGELGSVDHVFLNPRDGEESIAITNSRPRSAEERVLDAICNIGREGDGETTNDPVRELLSDPSLNRGQLQVPRNLDPLNEFTANDFLFYGAFPIAFSLGCGL